MKFFFQFLKDPKSVAALKPSSRFLARAIVEAAELANKTCVVELGSGNGVFTREIVQNLAPGAVFFAMEFNEGLVNEARKNVPQAITYHAPAEEIGMYLSQHDREVCDGILSALPWATVSRHEQEKLMDIIYHSLCDGGVFLTIANVQGLVMPSGRKFRKLLERKFKTVSRTRIIWRNLMPSIVYVCEK